MFKFEINDVKFHVLTTIEGYRLISTWGTHKLYPSILEAQKAAIYFMTPTEDNMDIGEYWDQRREYV